MTFRPPKLLVATVGVGVVLAAIFTALLVQFRAELHEEIRRTIVGRDAAVLHSVARQQVSATMARSGIAPRTEDLLTAVLPSAQQEGMLAVAVYDAQGGLVRALPAALLFAEIAAADYVALLSGGPISRYHRSFPLDRYFAGVNPASATAPVLEVLLPLEGGVDGARLGYAQYYIDARALGRELDAIERRLRRQTTATLLGGMLLITLVLTGSYLGLRRGERLVAERNVRLARAHFELTLATKTSALGELTSHLIHGLQGPVAGLRAAVTRGTPAGTDWQTAAGYTEQMQTMISEIVGLLGDATAGVTYELDGQQLIVIIRERNSANALAKGVRLVVENRLACRIDSHRGSLLCLIANNLVQNAIAATHAGYRVVVELTSNEEQIILSVADQGEGIADSVRERLFEPGATGRIGGSGLGLAISRRLARQIGGDLELVSTGAHGTIFRVPVPLHR
jgi:signal transduction histidine kinase